MRNPHRSGLGPSIAIGKYGEEPVQMDGDDRKLEPLCQETHSWLEPVPWLHRA